MIDKVLHPRITDSGDWATFMFILTLAAIAITKTSNETRFRDFINLIFSDKYAKVYRDSGQLNSGFTISLFFVQVISFAFFIQISLSIFGLVSKTDLTLFIQITTFLFFFILSKYLIEKIIATAFNIEEFAEQFNLQKITYRTYIGIILIPINLILFYHDSVSKNIPILILIIVLIFNIITYSLLIKSYQALVIRKLFYFILYLCTLEIAPYFFMYFLFKKVST